MLFLGLGTVGITLTAIVGGWVIFDQFFKDVNQDTTESEVPTVAYYRDEEWITEPHAGIKYLVEDDVSEVAGLQASTRLWHPRTSPGPRVRCRGVRCATRQGCGCRHPPAAFPHLKAHTLIAESHLGDRT